MLEYHAYYLKKEIHENSTFLHFLTVIGQTKYITKASIWPASDKIVIKTQGHDDAYKHTVMTIHAMLVIKISNISDDTRSSK